MGKKKSIFMGKFYWWMGFILLALFIFDVFLNLVFQRKMKAETTILPSIALYLFFFWHFERHHNIDLSK